MGMGLNPSGRGLTCGWIEGTGISPVPGLDRRLPASKPPPRRGGAPSASRDVMDVILHRADLDGQAPGDVAVGEAFVDQLEDFALAGRQ
jgi:hypothetical protein